MMKKIIATGTLILMVSTLSSVLTYRYLQDKYEVERDMLLAQINTLSFDIAQLQEELVIEGATKRCGTFNADAAHATVAYANDERGIYVDLPYNELWGYGENLPEPYQQLSGVDGILFGKPKDMGECRWAHTYQLTFLPPRTLEEIAEDVLQRNFEEIDNEAIAEENFAPKEVHINGHTFYSYSMPAFCKTTNFELIGEHYNYIFSACSADDSALESVLQSIKLL